MGKREEETERQGPRMIIEDPRQEKKDRKIVVIQIKPQLGNIIDESKRDGVGDSGVAVMLNRVTSSLRANKIIRRLLISSQIQENGKARKGEKEGEGAAIDLLFKKRSKLKT